MNYKLDCQAAYVEAELEAVEEGRTVIYSDERTLLLDLDTDEALTCFLAAFGENLLRFGLLDYTYRRSKSGIGWHALVALEGPADVPTRIAMQLVLGSDPVRETLCLVRWRTYGFANPIRLFATGPLTITPVPF